MNDELLYEATSLKRRISELEKLVDYFRYNSEFTVETQTKKFLFGSKLDSRKFDIDRDLYCAMLKAISEKILELKQEYNSLK